MINTLNNDTDSEQRTLGNPVLEMSLLHSALSKVWDVTRNLSLFGIQQNGNLAHSTKIDLNLSVSGIPSEQNNCSIEGVSLNVTCNNGDLRMKKDQPKAKGLTSLTPIKPADNEEFFSGTANPEILPVIKQTHKHIGTPMS